MEEMAAGTAAGMTVRYLLTLEYSGTDFAGSQRQKDRRTVQVECSAPPLTQSSALPVLHHAQEELEKALAKLSPNQTPPPTAFFAGRTDAGVHALGMTVHTEICRRDKAGLPQPPLEEAALLNALNAMLPKRCGVVCARRVPRHVDARRSAIGRHYIYVIKCNAVSTAVSTAHSTVSTAVSAADSTAVSAAVSTAHSTAHSTAISTAVPTADSKADSTVSTAVSMADSNAVSTDSSAALTNSDAALAAVATPEAMGLLRAEACPSLARRGWISVHDAHRAYCLPEPLDVGRMRRAAALLLGLHDFSSFRSNKCAAKSPVRKLEELSIVDEAPTVLGSYQPECARTLVLRVRAQSFLQHQVRYLVATLIEVGRGTLTVEKVQALLDARDNSKAPPPAPAHGLYLARVEYPWECFREDDGSDATRQAYNDVAAIEVGDKDVEDELDDASATGSDKGSCSRMDMRLRAAEDTDTPRSKLPRTLHDWRD